MAATPTPAGRLILDSMARMKCSSQREFCEICNMRPSTLNELITGQNPLRRMHAFKIYAADPQFECFKALQLESERQWEIFKAKGKF